MMSASFVPNAIHDPHNNVIDDLSTLNALIRDVKITTGWLYLDWLRGAPRPAQADEALLTELTRMRWAAAPLDQSLADRLAAEAAALSRILHLRRRLDPVDMLAAARRLAALPRAVGLSPQLGEGRATQTPEVGAGRATQTPEVGAGRPIETPAQLGEGRATQTPEVGEGRPIETPAQLGEGRATQTPEVGAGRPIETLEIGRC